MNKTIQDLAWCSLPKEFKEEVKRLYNIANKDIDELKVAYKLEYLFGIHNLTSDAEGEEMLTVSRKQVQEIYNHCNGGGAHVIKEIFGESIYDMNNNGIITPLDNFKRLPHLNEKQEVIKDYEGYSPTLYPYEDKWFVSWISSEGDSILDFQAESPEKAIELAYNHLFGSKCLPDEEPKPAEPKFKVGSKVRICSSDAACYGQVGSIRHIYGNGNVAVYFNEHDNNRYYAPRYLEPYAELTENLKPSNSGELESQKTCTQTFTDDTSTFTDNRQSQCKSQSRNLSQETANCDTHSNNSLTDKKNGGVDHFVVEHDMVKELRLTLAAQILGNIIKSEYYSLSDRYQEDNIHEIAKVSMQLTDALIAEAQLTNNTE